MCLVYIIYNSKMASSLLKYSYKGEEYTFVETQIQLLEEAECPICLDLVNQPVSTSCCGQLYCEKCIEGQEFCPTCCEEFTTAPDVGSTRLMKAFKVKCPNSSDGCRWGGVLGDAEEHLEKHCQYRRVHCPNECGEKVKRELLVNHTVHDCPQRIYKCPYCDQWGVYKDITTVHYANCGEVPLPCPAGCGLRRKRKRKNMESHLRTECPEEYVSCKYRMFGCDTVVRRREKESHLSDTGFHLEKSMESQIAIFQSLGTLFQSSTHIRPDVTDLPLSFRPWLQNTPTCYPRPPWVVKLVGFEEKKRNDEEWCSNPIYSHFGGYKMCLRVCPNGHDDDNEDDDDDEGTDVSVFSHLMKGDNDDHLKFPFKGHIVVSLLNQLEDKNHHTGELCSPEDDVSERTSGRITRGEMSSSGWGCAQFIFHEDLDHNSDDNCQYLKNDCLFFRVDKFESVL